MNSNLLKPILDIFLPRRCMLCKSEQEVSILCKSCLALCNRCALGSFVYSLDHKGAFFFYEFSIREALKKAKFQRNYAYARALCALLQEELDHNEHIARLRDFAPTGICYVPTHWARRALRALDMPSMFANIIAQHMKIPLVHALTKTHLKEPQSSLHSKSSRLSAVKDMFKIRPNIKNYERLVLVDDIVTTGATFDECTRILRKKSKEVICLAFAKTP